jgi:hypothetical protein
MTSKRPKRQVENDEFAAFGCGYSWTEISSRLGITRQAAQQRWGTSSR